PLERGWKKYPRLGLHIILQPFDALIAGRLLAHTLLAQPEIDAHVEGFAVRGRFPVDQVRHRFLQGLHPVTAFKFVEFHIASFNTMSDTVTIYGLGNSKCMKSLADLQAPPQFSPAFCRPLIKVAGRLRKPVLAYLFRSLRFFWMATS